MTRLAICVNPMSGRDVRRLAARATNMTFEAKRDMVARIAAGAEAAGVTDIFVTKEPFRIASAALELMGLSCRVHVLEHEIAHDAGDTQRSVEAFLEAGCDTVVTLGGDGTNRAVAKTTNAIKLVPLSTGTNNVFPQLIEPTGIDVVYLGGPEMRALAGTLPHERLGGWFPSVNELKPALLDAVRPGDAVMVKSSKGIGFSKLVEALIGNFPAESGSQKRA